MSNEAEVALSPEVEACRPRRTNHGPPTTSGTCLSHHSRHAIPPVEGMGTKPNDSFRASAAGDLFVPTVTPFLRVVLVLAVLQSLVMGDLPTLFG